MATTNANYLYANPYKTGDDGINHNSKPRDNSMNRNLRPSDNSFRPNSYKTMEGGSRMNPAPYQKSRDYNRNSYTDKDEEEGNRIPRSHKTADSKPKNQLELSDKYEAMKRIERDRKAKQRKLREEDTEKPKHPAMKQRRSSKSDWIKDYEYGLIDEDLDYAR